MKPFIISLLAVAPANLTQRGGSALTIEDKRSRFDGDALELNVSIETGQAREFGLAVYCDPDGKGGFPIAVEPGTKTLRLGAVKVPFELKAGERVELRVFLDKNLIEVFANDRQAVVASHKYAPQNLGISLFSVGGEIVATKASRWKIKSTYLGQ